MLNILYFLTDPVLIFINKAMIRDKAKIQANQVLTKIHHGVIIGLTSVYIFSFAKKVYPFTLFKSIEQTRLLFN